MTNITSITSSESGANSLTYINTNFSVLSSQKADILTGAAFTGAVTIVSSVTSGLIPLVLTQQDTTNNPRALDIANSGTANAVRITQTGNTSASISIGGAFNLNNTGNTGAGAVFYSNLASRSGRLVVVYDDNAAANVDTMLIQSDSAVNTPLNVQMSATGKGGIKVEHIGSGTGFSNAALISLDKKSATDVQGIFGDSTGGNSTGPWMQFRNSSSVVSTLDANGLFNAAAVRGTAVTFANLPTPVEGMMVAVTDSNTATWGATIAGSSTNHVLAYYNGTNWTVAGK